MSIVVAVQKNCEIVMAADSQNNFGSNREIAPNSVVQKITKIGSSYIATTGWTAYSQLLVHYCKGRKNILLNNEEQILNFFIGFWRTIRDKYHFVNDQCNKDDESPIADFDSTFLICNRKGIFQICDDMTVMKYEMYSAIGSGVEYATGAMHVLYTQKSMSAEKIAREAIDAAVQHNVYCGGDVQLVHIKALK